ncbi:MerR family DNA-binding transcriptional regulator [Streptomyces sp. NPDC048420]|uniref:MerR family DNA-binding transcriptional regulator n=1 Tax=Streptomyces sp. NPDC048420 TaxID=3155755 RepID=UPI0034175EEE
MAERLIRIGEVARGADVSVRAVRHYEQQGLGCSSRSAAPPASASTGRMPSPLTSRRITELLPYWDAGHRAMLRAEWDGIQAKVDDLRSPWTTSTRSSP